MPIVGSPEIDGARTINSRAAASVGLVAGPCLRRLPAMIYLSDVGAVTRNFGDFRSKNDCWPSRHKYSALRGSPGGGGGSPPTRHA